MFNRTVSFLIITVALLALLGCSTKNEGTLAGPVLGDRNASAFQLEVLDDSYFNGASAGSYDLNVTDYGEDVLVDIYVEDAQDLKALFVELSYDAQQYRPMVGEPSSAMGERDDHLVLSVLGTPGVMHYNHILKNPEWREGFTGSGSLAQVVFNKEPAVDLRTVSTPPTNAASATVLAFDNVDTLTWGYYCQGDYDQNTEVGAADLVPIAQNYLGAGPFDVNSAQAVIDGDSNGEINQADLVPIAQNFGVSTGGGWNVYGDAVAANYPDGGTLIGNVANATATGNPANDRLQYEYVIAPGDIIANGYYWVRASDGSTDGIESNLVGGNVADLPQLVLTNPPGTGDGTSGNPYQVDDATDYIFTLTDPSGPTDVSTNALTNWNVSNAGAGSVDTAGANAVLNVTDGFTGTFNVSATYDGTPSNPAALFFEIGGGGTGDLFIWPDPADTDWPATGDGSEGDPYVLDETDFSTEYSLLAGDAANGTGNPIAVGDLSWSSYPPFIATWTTDGTFQANQFTSGYVFAQDGATNDSNFLYVEVHSLPLT